MMRRLVLACFLAVSGADAQEVKFVWPLPTTAEAALITPEAFPDADAVIIFKEQGYDEGPHSRSLDAMTNEVTVRRRCVVAKVLNQSGVDDFASFDYEYPHRRQKEAQHRFIVRARVMKPDGTVKVHPDSAISNVVGTSTGRGMSLSRKVVFKLYDLAPGDVVQIEYVHVAPYSTMRRVLFPYHDRYPVLNSFVNITMDKDIEVEYVHLPTDSIGAPEVREIGHSISRTWRSSGLAAIPVEPFSRPFYDVTYLTAIVDRPDEDRDDRWRDLAIEYFRENIEPGSIGRSDIRSMGLNPSLQDPSWSSIDSAYTAVRKHFRRTAQSSLTPHIEEIGDIIESGEANPTDQAYILYKIIDDWGVTATPVLLRDRREGAYERSVPLLTWFDRLGVLVTHQGRSVLYDMDPGIPARYQYPWFLNRSPLVAVFDTGVAHVAFQFPAPLRERINSETHDITLRPGHTPYDTLRIALAGATAQRFRGSRSGRRGDDLTSSVRTLLETYALQEAHGVSTNEFFDDAEVRLMAHGNSRAVSTEIDSVLIVQPKDHLLRKLRSVFTAKKRADGIFLDEPMVYMLQWTIHAPPPFSVRTLPENVSLSACGQTAEIQYFSSDRTSCTIQAQIAFQTPIMPSTDYAAWQRFLDEVSAAIGRDVTFVATSD